MCFNNIDTYKNNKNTLPYNKKIFLIENFFRYKSLIGNKKKFTNSE